MIATCCLRRAAAVRECRPDFRIHYHEVVFGFLQLRHVCITVVADRLADVTTNGIDNVLMRLRLATVNLQQGGQVFAVTTCRVLNNTLIRVVDELRGSG